MNSTAAPAVDPVIEQAVRQMLKSGNSFNSVIDAMKSRGLNKIECIKLLRTHAGISLFDAKKAVHLSPAWAGRRQSDDTFHDSMKDAVDDLMVLDLDRDRHRN